MKVGMVGGGQLARMTHQAAIAIGVELTVLDPGPAPAADAGARLLQGAADDLEALRALASGTDVLTFDHEGVPPALLLQLERDGHVVRPRAAAKLLAQDKRHAREALGGLGLPVPEFAAVASVADVEALAQRTGWPVVLKAVRGGYDGRGVRVVADRAEAEAALADLGGEAVAEAHVDLAAEVAVLVARRPSGEARAWALVETVQVDGMLRELVVPARVPAAVADEALALALDLAERADATGVMAVELFLDREGALLVNELALRPHNSGHWTIEGAETSQFEQHLRAVLDWPLGATELRAPAVATVNVVGGAGDPHDGLAQALAVEGAHVHLYGKAPRPGRKLGHVTALGPDPDTALAAARRAAEALEAA